MSWFRKSKCDIADELRAIRVELRNIGIFLRRLVRPVDPGPIFIRVDKDTEMPSRILFSVSLPEWPENQDVDHGELSIQITGVEPQTLPVAFGATSVDGLEGDQDADVSLSFVYVDDAGNRSESPSTYQGVLSDTIPPPAPGQLGLVITGESNDSTP